MISLSLPELPPSVNAAMTVRKIDGAYRIGKTVEYTSWINRNSWTVLSQRRGQCIAGPVEFGFIAKRPHGNADLDNFLKASIDSVAKGGAIENDKQIVRIVAEWGDVEGVAITLRAVGDAA